MGRPPNPGGIVRGGRRLVLPGGGESRYERPLTPRPPLPRRGEGEQESPQGLAHAPITFLAPSLQWWERGPGGEGDSLREDRDVRVSDAAVADALADRLHLRRRGRRGDNQHPADDLPEQ